MGRSQSRRQSGYRPRRWEQSVIRQPVSGEARDVRGVVDYLIDGRITEPSVARRRDSKKGASEEMRERRLVPEVGVEPTHPCGYGILSPARLPVSPLRRFEC